MENNLSPIEWAQMPPEEKVRYVEQWPSFAQMSPEEQEWARNAVRDASRINTDVANTEARCAVWGEEAGPDDGSPKPKRSPRGPYLKTIKERAKKLGATYVIKDGVTYGGFDQATEQQSDTDRELAEFEADFEARHGQD